MRNKTRNTHGIAIDGRRVRVRQLRIYNRTVEFLRTRNATMTEIMDFVNTYVNKNGRVTQSSATRTQLTNILSKYPTFCKVGTTRKRGNYSFKGSYEVNIWGLANDSTSDISEN